MELHRDQVPDLFASLGVETPIDAVDASQDGRRRICSTPT